MLTLYETRALVHTMNRLLRSLGVAGSRSCNWKHLEVCMALGLPGVLATSTEVTCWTAQVSIMNGAVLEVGSNATPGPTHC